MNQQFYQFLYQRMPEFQLEPDAQLAFSKQKMTQLIEQLPRSIDNALELGSGVGYDAMALNQLGVDVTAIELDIGAMDAADSLQRQFGTQVAFVQEDFYQYQPNELFDFVYYIDGFGAFSDEAQQQLLKRITTWLQPEGYAYIDVYNADYWRTTHNVKMNLTPTLMRMYQYDEASHQFIDNWHDAQTGETQTQVLKCYTLDDVKRMVTKAGLTVHSVTPSGKMDYDKMEWVDKATLSDCMYFQVLVVK
ncbi:class I SAM-dependent methyltransferase [Aerococcaceae bacterium zg-BR9]|uniref:class I SAM-dependent methyltransferase n=1 Tax=Aerococcaceae bacterium zg-1292 TaxID=2774330 RepID=UPI004062841D|nr:class I SAM-dependent methyltransferase [Aerococcaceae bacterium zg-BR9]